MLSRTKKKALFLTIALVLFSLNLPQAFAKSSEGTAKVSFSAKAKGEAAILLDWFPGPGSGPTEIIFAKASVSLKGSATAMGPNPPNDDLPYTFFYSVTGVRAEGEFHAKTEDRTINVIFESKGESGGVFIDKKEGNAFLIGITPGAAMMTYKATIKDHQGKQVVSGKAGVFAYRFQTPGVMTIGVALLKEDGSPLLTIMWMQEDTVFPWGGTLHAASKFECNVKAKL